MAQCTILFEDEEIAWAEAESHIDAKNEAIEEAKVSFYGCMLEDCTYSLVDNMGAVSRGKVVP